MIKFFRKIRYDLIEKNKTGKYIKYAFGEVILVVIGILIALQLNNLNEIKKDRDYERNYLHRIKSDLNQDIAELEKHFKTDTLKLDSYTFLSRNLSSNTVKTSPEIILNHLGIVFKLNWFEGNNIVFDDMKSAGKTSLIESDTLRSKIQKYYRLFDEVIKQENLHNSNISNHFKLMASSINLSPILELGMPQRWNANVGKFTMNDFDTMWNNFTENQKINFIKNSSGIKSQILSSNAVRLSLYQEGIGLTKLIDNILKNKK